MAKCSDVKPMPIIDAGVRRAARAFWSWVVLLSLGFPALAQTDQDDRQPRFAVGEAWLYELTDQKDPQAPKRYASRHVKEVSDHERHVTVVNGRELVYHGPTLLAMGQGAQRQTYQPGRITLPLPAPIGKTQISRGSAVRADGTTAEHFHVETTAKAWEQIETPLGKFTVLRLEQREWKGKEPVLISKKRSPNVQRDIFYSPAHKAVIRQVDMFDEGKGIISIELIEAFLRPTEQQAASADLRKAAADQLRTTSLELMDLSKFGPGLLRTAATRIAARTGADAALVQRCLEEFDLVTVVNAKVIEKFAAIEPAASVELLAWSRVLQSSAFQRVINSARDDFLSNPATSLNDASGLIAKRLSEKERVYLDFVGNTYFAPGLLEFTQRLSKTAAIHDFDPQTLVERGAKHPSCAQVQKMNKK
jgi:hypothetical protein